MAAVATTLVLVMSEWAPHGQSPQNPPPHAPAASRPGPEPARTGTGRIRGRVRSGDSGAPIRRAEVLLAGEPVGFVQTLTDAAGRFEFRDLPAGRFELISMRAGYISGAYGAARPREAARALDLADKQLLDVPDILMFRGQAIVGRIVDESGDPLDGVMVRAVRQEWMNGRRHSTSAGHQDETNDLGEYRIYGLEPGQYHVLATLRSGGGPTSGMRGQPPGPRPGYASSYYPGTAVAAEAAWVTVGPGRDSVGVDFPVIAVRLTRITGLVIGSDERPLGGAIVMLVWPPGSGLGGPLSSGQTAGDGRFTLNDVPPGDYTLAVAKRAPVVFLPGGLPGALSASGDGEFGAVPVKVTGGDLAAGVITTTRSATVTGRVVFEGQRPVPFESMRIAPLEAEADGPFAFFGTGGDTPVKPDGSFEVKGLAGVRLFRVLGAPSGWTVRSAQLAGADIIDTGMEFKGAERVSGLELVLSRQRTEISGRVVSAVGKPSVDYTVVIFAEDPTKWRVASGRWVTGARPSQDGRFRVRGMPPGAYYAVAVDYIPDSEWLDPEVLERLRSRAQRVSLEEGQPRTLELKLRDGGA